MVKIPETEYSDVFSSRYMAAKIKDSSQMTIKVPFGYANIDKERYLRYKKAQNKKRGGK